MYFPLNTLTSIAINFAAANDSKFTVIVWNVPRSPTSTPNRPQVTYPLVPTSFLSLSPDTLTAITNPEYVLYRPCGYFCCPYNFMECNWRHFCWAVNFCFYQGAGLACAVIFLLLFFPFFEERLISSI